MAVPGKVTNVQVFDQYDGAHLLVSWDLVAATPSVTEYRVYRSLTSDFSQATLANGGITILQQLVDQAQTIRETWYYFVTAKNADGESAPSDPVASNRVMFTNTAVGNIKWLVPEVIRRRRLILTLDGEDGHFLLRKVSGERCSCFEPRRAQGDPRCPICYGVYFVGGYVVIPTRFRIMNRQELKVRQEMGLQLDNKPRGWNVTYPLVKSMDVLVQKNNRRLRVLEVYPGLVNGVLTRQTFSLQELEPTDPMYLKPVP